MQALNELSRPFDRHRGSSRAGFTMIELLGVIVIILILMALIIPSVGAAMRVARNAKVRAEITGLDTGLSTFKNEFGAFPPSHITFPEQNGTWSNETLAVLRSMFPQISIDAALEQSLVDAQIMKTAGNGSRELNGAQCLVFFLGGVPRVSGGAATTEMIGFSKNPKNPFQQPASASSGSRIGPFYEFDAGRLTSGVIGGVTYDTFVYLDGFPSSSQPYLYASSWEGAGYEVGTGATAVAAQANSDVPALVREVSAGVFESGPYRQTANGTHWKAQSYQIISSGIDQNFGLGGVYNPDDTSTLIEADRDNITNFSDGGTLGG
ncbi:type II secretion system protein [Stratiformator vulcanicus]|uniref:Type II secretion system protein G n=1 Tax=Stratiformator vulcanicus TaxID=2527980 RepID=A0A517R112_9PLAN|nr:prepilin-type N-terminal cleavage/methylation domain-containing protein [Stratiformator vulcanicus]QDT37533.1 hypothetical protein Pan189_19130 [Stratiformator vulcanicus]